MADKNEKIGNVPGNGQLESEGFCVALTWNDQTIKSSSTKPEDFLEIINEADIAWINFPMNNPAVEGIEIAKKMGFNPFLFQSLLTDSPSGYEDMDSELGMKVPVIRVLKLQVDVYPLFILIRKGLILTIHPVEVIRLNKFARYAEAFMKKIPLDSKWNDKITMTLYRLLAENNACNFDGLRAIEEEADIISKDLLNPKISRQRISKDIYRMKHSLIVYLNALWNILDVLQSLRYGDAEVISDDPSQLIRLESLVTDVNGQISLSEHMSDVLASGLEVLQSIYNNQLQILNNKLAFIVAWLTILGTAVLVPNTIATIMGSSAFNLEPDDMWWYLLLMAGSTAAATFCAWLLVRKWIPRNLE